MHKPAPLFVLLFVLNAPAFGQGYESIGPGLSGWTNVRQMTFSWTNAATYDIAATTFNGIAFRPSSLPWDYSRMANSGFIHAEFSPWSADSIFIGTSSRTGQLEYTMNLIRRQYPSLLYLLTSPPPWGIWSYPNWAIAMFFTEPSDSVCIVDIHGAFWKSADRGRSWHQLLNQPGGFSFSLMKEEGSKNFVYACGIPYSIYNYSLLARSSNYGESWDSVFYANTSFRCTFSIGDTLLVGGVHPQFDSTSLVGIFHSTNNGISWEHAYAASEVFGIVKSPTSAKLFAVSGEGILVSINFGTTWTPYNNNLAATHFTDVAISPYSDTLFVATETAGILKVWNYLTDIASTNSQPYQFELMQNYPNPFNPTTRISFTIPHSSFVILKVFDVLGREVATLVNEEMTAGDYKRTLDGSGLASGVYLYRIQTAGFTQSRKLLLLR